MKNNILQENMRRIGTKNLSSLRESKSSDALAKEINKAMIKIDDSMSYTDFALAVGKILKDEYGSHNYGPFVKDLQADLYDTKNLSSLRESRRNDYSLMDLVSEAEDMVENLRSNMATNSVLQRAEKMGYLKAFAELLGILDEIGYHAEMEHDKPVDESAKPNLRSNMATNSVLQRAETWVKAQDLKKAKTNKTLNRSKNKFTIEDFPEGTRILFKDGEEWIVVKKGMRGSGTFRKSDEITIKPYNKLAKDRNVSLSIDVNLKYLNNNIDNIDKLVNESLDETKPFAVIEKGGKNSINEYGEDEFDRSSQMYSKGKSSRESNSDFDGTGLIVVGRTQIDNNEIADMVDEGDYYGVWNGREGYWFFPEAEETLDGLEMELSREFDNRGINARFEGQFN